MANKLLVEGLDWGVTDSALRAAFAPFGRVLEAKVATDWETGRSRGFGHVTFDDETSARLALETMDGASLEGKVLRVMEAPDAGRRSLYRGGDYGHVSRSQRDRQYRGGDYSDSRKATKDVRVYRSANFGYADGPTGPSTYRAADFDGPGRTAKGAKSATAPPAQPEPEADSKATKADATAPAGTPEPAPKEGPKRGGANAQGWRKGGNEGIGDSGKTFG